MGNFQLNPSLSQWQQPLIVCSFYYAQLCTRIGLERNTFHWYTGTNQVKLEPRYIQSMLTSACVQCKTCVPQELLPSEPSMQMSQNDIQMGQRIQTKTQTQNGVHPDKTCKLTEPSSLGVIFFERPPVNMFNSSPRMQNWSIRKSFGGSTAQLLQVSR